MNHNMMNHINLNYQPLALTWYDLIEDTNIDYSSSSLPRDDDALNETSDYDDKVVVSLDNTPWLKHLHCKLSNLCLETKSTANDSCAILSERFLLLLGPCKSNDWFHFNANRKEIRLILSEMYNSAVGADVMLVPSDGESLLCHKFVLSTFSDYFSARFSDKWDQVDDEDTNIKKVCCDSDSAAIQLLLRYFYGENIFNLTKPVSVYDMINCYVLAHYWLCPSFLLEEILDYIFCNVTAKTCVWGLTLAETYSLNRLKDKCLTVAISQMTSNGLETDKLDGVLSPLSDSASVEMTECMQMLRRSLTHIKSKYNFQVESVRELVGILKESLLEEEEVWRVSLLRNNEEMQKCQEQTAAVEARQASRYYNKEAKMSELLAWSNRLLSVKLALERHAIAIQRRRFFYEQQQQCLQKLEL